MTGRVVDSVEVSERFLWDLRQTISELVLENYAGHFRDLAHRYGLRRISYSCRNQFQCCNQPRAGTFPDLPFNSTLAGVSLKFSITQLPSPKR